MENNSVSVEQTKNGEPFKKLTREEKLSEAKLEDQVNKIRLFFDRCIIFFFISS